MPRKQPKPGRRGRPPLPRSHGKRHQIGLRVTAALRKQLELKAAESERSMSQEAEIRLEQSFRDEQHIVRELGGERNVQLFRFFSQFVRYVEALHSGKSWLEDYEVFTAAQIVWQMAIHVMAHRPTDQLKVKAIALKEELQQLQSTKPRPPSEESPAAWATYARESQEWARQRDAFDEKLLGQLAVHSGLMEIDESAVRSALGIHDLQWRA